MQQSIMKPFHIKRGICILEAKVIDSEFGEPYSFEKTDGTVVKRNDRELRLTITYCAYCGTPKKPFPRIDKTQQECP